MLLDVAETVLEIFGFDRSLLGKPRDKKWWIELRRNMVPVDSNGRSESPNNNGAFKNVISGERMFVKSYIQLWQSDSDQTVRSHVFSYDRPLLSWTR